MVYDLQIGKSCTKRRGYY